MPPRAIRWAACGGRTRRHATWPKPFGGAACRWDTSRSAVCCASKNIRCGPTANDWPKPTTLIAIGSFGCWQVADIAATVRGLTERGVSFERYPQLGQDELGVWSVPDGSAKVAWFRDPDGNVLSVVESPHDAP